MGKVEMKLCGLAMAAKMVQNELLKQGDWYNALVVSIGNCLEGITSEMLENGVDPARMIADRIIGLEEQDRND